MSGSGGARGGVRNDERCEECAEGERREKRRNILTLALILIFLFRRKFKVIFLL